MTPFAHLFTLFLAFALLVQTAIPLNVAHAAGDFDKLLNDTDLSFQIHQLEEKRDSVRIRRSKAGVVVCSLLAGVGFGLLLGGVVVRQQPTTDEFGLETARGAGLISVGTVLLVPNLIGLALSSKRLHDRKQEIRKIDAEIARLQAVASRKR